MASFRVEPGPAPDRPDKLGALAPAAAAGSQQGRACKPAATDRAVSGSPGGAVPRRWPHPPPPPSDGVAL